MLNNLSLDEVSEHAEDDPRDRQEHQESGCDCPYEDQGLQVLIYADLWYLKAELDPQLCLRQVQKKLRIKKLEVNDGL